MSKLSKIALLLSTFAVIGLGLYVGGCSKDSPTGSAKAATTELCVKCGQIKGSETCCKPDAAKCDKCSLAKGAPGCCVIPKDAKKIELCNKCGQIAGGAKCCAPNAAKCASCGLAKGAPGCCKLPKSE